MQTKYTPASIPSLLPVLSVSSISASGSVFALSSHSVTPRDAATSSAFFLYSRADDSTDNSCIFNPEYFSKSRYSPVSVISAMRYSLSSSFCSFKVARYALGISKVIEHGSDTGISSSARTLSGCRPAKHIIMNSILQTILFLCFLPFVPWLLFFFIIQMILLHITMEPIAAIIPIKIHAR